MRAKKSHNLRASDGIYANLANLANYAKRMQRKTLDYSYDFQLLKKDTALEAVEVCWNCVATILSIGTGTVANSRTCSSRCEQVDAKLQPTPVPQEVPWKWRHSSC